MNFKRILGIATLIAGIVLLFISNNIHNQLNAGREEISEAQKNVGRGNRLFSLHPVTKEIGKGVSSIAEKKINEGEETIAHYAMIANWCQNGGIALIVLGTIIVIFSRKKRKN